MAGTAWAMATTTREASTQGMVGINPEGDVADMTWAMVTAAKKKSARCVERPININLSDEEIRNESAQYTCCDSVAGCIHTV